MIKLIHLSILQVFGFKGKSPFFENIRGFRTQRESLGAKNGFQGLTLL